MPHNYAADSTFQDVMARLAGTDAPFSAVWPTLKGAILSGRALTAAEYRPLNALISEAHATRIARNEALNAPHLHSTIGDVAHSVGAPDDQEPAPAIQKPTSLPDSLVEKAAKEITGTLAGSTSSESEKEGATATEETAPAKESNSDTVEKAENNPKKEAEK